MRTATRAFLWLLLVTGHASRVTDAAENATIRVRPERAIGAVNRLILGDNMLGYANGRNEYCNLGAGIWDPEKRCSVPEVVALAKGRGLSCSRWPGGCEAHRFEWKKTVGPLAERSNQRFGLPEFMQNCADIGAIAVITLGDFVISPEDAADMVEYLNAPNDGKNPNGGRDWAALRAADGHPEPWGVVWFEFGNESDHGDHKGGKFTPKGYAERFLATRRAMRAVDPRIKLGAVLENTKTGQVGPWTREVLKTTAKELDFAIHHCYVPGYYANDGKPPAEELFALSLAADAQIADLYRSLNALIRELTGRDDVPLAITEFNGHFVQQKPVPYRHCLGNALVNAEVLRVLMQPEHHIALANHWQFANEYWGSVKGYKPPYVKRPNYYVFELYHQHFGDVLVEADVTCSRFESDGGYGVRPRRGQPGPFQLFPDDLLPKQDWALSATKGATHRIEDGVVAVEFDGTQDVNYHHAQKAMPAEPLTGYRLTGWVKTEGLTTGSGAGFQTGDGRGWPATHSASCSPSVVGTSDWTKLELDYVTLGDTKNLQVICRRISGAGALKGKAWYRGVQVQKFRPKSYGAAPLLTVNASRSRDGSVLHLMIVNKSLREPVPCTIEAEGLPTAEARAWALTGPACDATNEREPLNVTVREQEVTVNGGKASLKLAPCSVTALELRRR
ncbi:MAG TPA: alpha-L-arabinofuranosidase C-terminal domain-containing protein [Planctomycetota bacterium]|nr:alpha-L-arabinofuranosidase C-terminal domain-containing protein [Planctomycetota bacterium]